MSAVFVDDPVPQWVLYCVCGYKKRLDQLFVFLGKVKLQIQAIYGSNVMIVQHVRKCCREFSGCRVSVTRPPHQQILSLQLSRLCANRQVLLKESEEQFNLSHGTILVIVHEQLTIDNWTTDGGPQEKAYGCIPAHLRFNDHGEDFLEKITGDETWVHEYCYEEISQSMAWKHPASPTIKQLKTSTSSWKLMAYVFWDMHGVLLVHFSSRNSQFCCLSGHSE